MSTENYELMEYAQYTYKSEYDKAVNTLEGILNGIAIDNRITQKEIEELNNWSSLYKELTTKKPFDELLNALNSALSDNVLSDDEIKDLLWVCKNLTTSNKYYDIFTADIQRLHGIMHGVLADNEITNEEVQGLMDWINENKHLCGLYPYDELNTIITDVLRDNKLDDQERKILKVFFSDFINMTESYNINAVEIEKLKSSIKIEGVCSLNPQITIEDSLFCFTGVSTRSKRSDIQKIVESLNGKFKDNVTKDTRYLVIGDGGNPCWAFSCYGRKVEQAIVLRKEGKPIQIIHENDFWDAVSAI